MTRPRGQQDGPRIQAFREASGLSRRQLADQLKLRHEQTLTNIELGNKPASLDMLTKIADALGVQLTDIIMPGTTLHKALTRSGNGGGAAA